MTKRWEHIHRPELRIFFIFCFARLPVKRDINVVFMPRLIGKCIVVQTRADIEILRPHNSNILLAAPSQVIIIKINIILIIYII